VWSSIVRQLFAVGALQSASAEHGGFALTPKGEEILFGREKIALRDDPAKPREPRVSQRGVPALDAVEDGLLAALKRKRRDLARAENVPAFMIFADRTLIDMAERRPSTLEDLRRVHGVGERKIARYGEAFLEALEEALR
jgi:ATP-dependent DNA helicase RecQ